ncbi:MAG: hypothetical protein H3C48_11345 [Chitinophagaceae bacterium]|nr:hypothetical protein [Chitinophagaceae bacterium]
MSSATIKEQLHNYLEIADDRKLRAIYTMVEDEIRESTVEYSDEFKAELDRRVNHYLNGGKMVTPAEMNKRLQRIRKKRT